MKHEITRRTRGDQHRVECPACGKIIADLWEWSFGYGGGGALQEGEEFECDHCGKDITVESADVVINITLVTTLEGV